LDNPQSTAINSAKSVNLSANIRLGCKRFVAANTLAYWRSCSSAEWRQNQTETKLPNILFDHHNNLGGGKSTSISNSRSHFNRAEACAIKFFTDVINGGARFFAFSLIIEGTTEKVLQFIMPIKSIYNRNLVSLNNKCIFEHYREFQARKTLVIDIIFAIIKKIHRPFQSCPLYVYVSSTQRCAVPLSQVYIPQIF